jgi:cold shock CspA family protein
MRQTGTVKWFDPAKGFGFITPHDKTQPEVFVHWSGIRGSTPQAKRRLTDGARVEYSAIIGKDGRPKADDVTVVS